MNASIDNDLPEPWRTVMNEKLTFANLRPEVDEEVDDFALSNVLQRVRKIVRYAAEGGT